MAEVANKIEKPSGVGQRVRQSLGIKGLVIALFVCGILVVLTFAQPTGGSSTHTLSITSPVCGNWVYRTAPRRGFGTSLDSVYGLSAISSTQVWAAGIQFPFIGNPQGVVEYWDGATFRTMNIPLDAEKAYSYDVEAVSSEDIWIVGSEINGTIRQSTLALHWDGAEWSPILTPNAARDQDALYSVVAISSDDVWAVGRSQGRGRDGAFRTWGLAMQWDGAAWRLHSVPEPTSGDYVLSGVAAFATDDVWAVGDYTDGGDVFHNPSKTLALHWDGRSWQIVPTPNPCSGHNSLVGISGTSGEDVWAVGSCTELNTGEYSYTSPRKTLIQHWNGKEWRVVPSPNPLPSQALVSVAAVSTNDVWAVGGSVSTEQEQSVVEHWDGTKWSVVPGLRSSEPEMYHEVATASGSSIIAAGQTGDRVVLAEFVSTPCTVSP
jgi:hypothetical protein